MNGFMSKGGDISAVIVTVLDITKLNIASWCIGLYMLLDGHSQLYKFTESKKERDQLDD